jgi:thiol-disulfide isomerase/thioredoxin
MEDQDYFGESRYVKELKPSDFDDYAPWLLKPHKYPISGFVLYYAPWCPHCKLVQEPFIEAAKTSGFCDYMALNCEKQKNHKNKIVADMPHLIQGYPSIIVYKNGSPSHVYTGERTTEGFLQECMKVCGDGKCKND